jgi:hypothetical protein
MSLTKSVPMVERIEVLQRNIPEDWSIKDRISCKENLHLGCEDDIIKIVQMEGAKCINTWGPTREKGRTNWARMGLGRSAQVGRPDPLWRSVRPSFSCTWSSFNPKSWRHRHSKEREPFTPRGHPQARERREIVREKDRSTRRKHPQVEKKTPSEASPWSTVPCLAPWWGNLLICSWVVINFEM